MKKKTKTANGFDMHSPDLIESWETMQNTRTEECLENFSLVIRNYPKEQKGVVNSLRDKNLPSFSLIFV